ncbi:hypothetical protein NC651_013119 [Populus alba x Populus x berolinensis]|nr:hypothetical protein NC651_013119 [Populus alba x Populus x berolinensis]
MEGTDDFSTICFALLALNKATPFVEGPVTPMRTGALFLHGCHFLKLRLVLTFICFRYHLIQIIFFF